MIINTLYKGLKSMHYNTNFLSVNNHYHVINNGKKNIK